ncbi:MAG: pitrilysin family protein [Planctomycetia bacterium]|nr:pitrilysin family protein [Planctomycetia bacterium]
MSRYILLVLLSVGMVSTSFGESDLDMGKDEVKVASRETYPGEITLAKLTNGLTVIVQENHTAPVATVRCAVKNTGSINEGKYLGSGISHVLEHVVSGGSTTKRSEDEIRTLIDTFGGMTNAYTSLDVTSYYIDCPAKNVETCIELIADAMQHCAFEESEFHREMEVVQQELADGQENRQRVLWKLAQETMYQESPARIPIIGYLNVLRQVQHDQIIDFYKTRYVPNNQIFVVVGDVDTEKVLRQVTELWQGTPRGFENTPVLPQEPPQIAPREATVEMDGSTTDILLAFPTVTLQHPDLYALDLLSYILSEGQSSRMVRDMQYDQSLVLSVGTSSYTPTYANGYFAVKMVVSPEKEKEAVKRALEHLYDAKETLVTDAELAKAKKQKAAELVFGRQTVQQMAEGLAQSYMSTGTPVFDEIYVESLQRVTAEEIQAVAKKYFRPEVLNVVKIVPRQEAEVAAARQEDAREWAEKGATHFLTLENGLRVLVKRVEHLPLVDVKVYALGGNLRDSEKQAGRSAFLAAMLDKGTKTRTAEEIVHYFDSIGGMIAFSAGRNTISGNVFVLKEDLASATEILADCLKNATFPEEKFQQVKTLMLGAIARRNDNPQAEIMELFADTLPKTTPYHLVSGGKLATIEPMSTADLQAYYQEIFVPQNMILTVYGDIDETQTLELVKKHFGTIPAAKDFEPLSFDFVNTLPANLVRHKQTGKNTGLVLLAYAAPSIRDKEDYAAMKVLEAVMAGCGYPGGWLHEELRGEGLVYAVHGVTLSGPAPGYMVFFAQTSPDKVEEVTRRLFQNVEKAKAGNITADEFRVAKEMILAMHAQGNTTVGEQATVQGLDELYGFGYDYDKTFDARYENVTMEEVVAVAKKYFTNHLLVTTSNREKQ